ncbi:fimbrial protein [Yokenella regensburgei]|jgi:major type 1 subunit fimbrin (pilin)|uniref:Fimbrial protein SthA n=1 Tax=Yokenella regensburgei TaxID=158877 RepID=A0AB38FXN2_9ENTR|nr:fimbrial protein [Yokenella regensburgei]EHM45158.1 fimbrial protein [Yokenella regensburgei ATCC 43003]KAF1367917.1 major type 1 subunit fimbrin (pilin) [Yokenella regensburgei]KFD21835.1 fimbrial protein [Yokenella regensburgei ATCC 49455]MDQ4428594.1 fimbrial protein [Yokenella regensburgei]QIU89624.1 type 1 fimbrial protein [Yokenella regensburgei]
MNVNNIIKTRVFAFATLPLLFSSVAIADSANTITFKGEVTEQTCEVSVNGVNARPVVLLPTVSKSELSQPGSFAGLTTFTLGVTGCTASASALDIKTIFVANNMTALGNLANTGTATDVELQLMTDGTGTTPIDLRNATGIAGISVPAGSTSGEHDYGVRYFSAAGGAGAGTVVGSVQYAVSYL